MAKIILRHLIETPVRYEAEFEARGLEDCRLDHALYELPGPTTVDLGKARVAQPAPVDTAEMLPQRDESRFQVLLDVVQFQPEDIIIQTFEGWLLIKAQHGTRMDEHGFISRSFTRQYKLPIGTETKDLSAILCHDGILVVEVKDSGSGRGCLCLSAALMRLPSLLWLQPRMDQ
ncbi:heat shock protein beta-3 isoform X1 [Kogia breviceps]|uniref:heat shock protein beta-3 isoform X1 n=1 Tax=Kogia breviceps TaxID=27615 RepID=UPI002796365E|nr:heat shock protein beta-3 isoform X1 [Kogia breviceps]